MDWFAHRLLAWFDGHGRKHLPWQRNPTPYRVWVSETMLQQTQVQTVIPYYERFVASYPDVHALATADLDQVLHLWTGLGYYARGRNLHKAAIRIARRGGEFPSTREGLEALPGVGRSTASAILALAFGRRAAILDGNAKRVLGRFHALEGDPGRGVTLKQLWELAEAHTPESRAAAYTQAIMDLGATVCVRRVPKCASCPLMERCEAFAQGRAEEFPQRRPAVEKPVRKARMFVITTPAGECLLERWPEGGIWGGLWTPPQRGTECTVAEIRREFGFDGQSVSEHRAGRVFRHTFSHFHLDIEPVHLVLSEKPALVAEGQRTLWFGPGQTQNVGLPAPAVRLLASLPQLGSTA